MANHAIEVEHLTKTYRLYHSPKDRVRELISVRRKKYHHEFHALKDVSFLVQKGETVGIIGQNGSGKSTLLKVVCGVVRPTGGAVTIDGRISSLLELGAGFHPEFTGKENVYMNGALMGLSRDEIDRRFPEIEEFADIGEFIDQPVKTYSSGMFVRLAFSAAIHVDPQILIVDEALSVGDMFFQSKCLERLKKMIANGLTLLFVSHDVMAVKALCHSCILLHHGALIDYGRAGDVVDAYIVGRIKGEQNAIKIISEGSHDPQRDRSLGADTIAAFQKRASFQRIQNGKASFVSIQLLSMAGDEVQTVEYQEEVILRMVLEVHEDLPCLLQAYLIKNKDGIHVVYSDSNIENANLYMIKRGERWVTDWRFQMALQNGSYSIACSASIPTDLENEKVEHCDFITLALQFEVRQKRDGGLFGLVHWVNKVETYQYRVNRLYP